GSMAVKSTAPPSSTSAETVLRLLTKVDAAVSLHLYTFFQPYLPYALLKFFELSGDGRLFFPIIISVLSLRISSSSSIITPTNLLLMNLLIGSVLDLLLIGLIKHLIQRPRPVYNKNMFVSFAVDHWSFPSGHSSRVSFIATYCILFSNRFLESWISERLLFLLLSVVGVWAVLTSVSRVLLGRHFVMDVVAGMCIGILEGLAVFRFVNYVNIVRLSSWF
ncbi:hypothetical protein M569_00687, partial [Genlisea aurea]